MKALILTLLLIESVAVQEPQIVLTCCGPDQTSAEKTLTPADEDDIREAVFRYQFEHNASGQQQKAKTYFLSLDKDKDPSDLFMLRFKDHKPPVKRRSQSITKGDVIDKQTGKRGIIFSVNSIKQVAADEVKVDGGYYEADLSSSGNTYTVKRKENKWVVTADKLRWIS